MCVYVYVCVCVCVCVYVCMCACVPTGSSLLVLTPPLRKSIFSLENPSFPQKIHLFPRKSIFRPLSDHFQTTFYPGILARSAPSLLPLSRTYGKERPRLAPFVQDFWQGSAPSMLPLSGKFGKEAPPACSLCPGLLARSTPQNLVF